jgi:hypothetical protein
MSMLHIMDRTGDTKLSWSQNNAAEVAVAKAAFDEAVGKRRMMAFSVDEGGKQGERIREFDPTAERIILAPALAGG